MSGVDLEGGMEDLDMGDLDGGMDGGMDIVDVKKWMLDLWEKGRRRGREKARAAIIAESQGILRESARNRKELGRLAKDGNRKEKVKVDMKDQEARDLRKVERRREKDGLTKGW